MHSHHRPMMQPLADLAFDLAPHAAQIAESIIGTRPTSRSSREARFRSKGSLAIVIAGPNRGAFFDHEAGIGGDALDLIAHLHRSSIADAAAWGRAFIGGVPSMASRRHEAVAAEPAKTTNPPRTGNLAKSLWNDSIPAAGTLAERYLASRGVRPEPGPLRFHPACPRGADRLPAMLALMTDPVTGHPTGVHRTFLLPDGSGKAEGQAKMMVGNAGAIRLSPDAEVTAGLGIAEGIETALSLMQGFGWRPVWAASSAGAIARFPLLDGIEALTIFADLDGPGRDAAKACAGRWSDADREARILTPPAGDWNDAHRMAA